MTNNLKNYITGYLGIDSVTAGEFITRLSDLCNYSGTPMSSKLKLALNYYLGAKMTSIISDYTSFSGSTLTQAELRKIANTFPTNYDGVNIRNEFIDLFSASCQQWLLGLYPGAAAAYSVRKLSNSYTGAAIRVRRTGIGAEQDIGFVGEDLDTATLLSFVGPGEDGFITKWYDQSGNGNHAIQAGTSDQPKIVDLGSLLTVNSNPCIQFATSDLLSLTSTITISGSDLTSFTVGQRTGALFYMAGTSIPSPHITFQSGGGFVFSTNSFTANFSPASSSQVLLTSTSVSNVLGMRKDGVSQSITPTPGVLSGGLTTIGKYGTNSSSGKIQEIVLYTSNQSASVAAIETNINSYFNIYP